MNAGKQVIDFLYTQLQVDDEWAIRHADGFTWWAAEQLQTVDIIGEETSPDGTTGYLISVQTEAASDLDLTEDVAAELNGGPMRFPSLAGPVYIPDSRTLRLCTTARVHAQTAQWMGVLLASASVLQLSEARMIGAAFAASGASAAVTGHPERGFRQQPDEMASAASVFAAGGATPLRLTEQDFLAALNTYMLQPPSVAASVDNLGITVEFPFGEESSLCVFLGTQRHPLYGNGLLVVHRFPQPAESEFDGTNLALELNLFDCAGDMTGYGFGSFVYADNMLCHNVFVPNNLLGTDMLGSLYYASAMRALAISSRFLGRGWDENSFTPQHSAIGRQMFGEEN